MKILRRINLIVLVFLAITSGIAKIILMPQEIEFFGGIGFSNSMLIIFGASQIIGGLMMTLSKTRFVGAIIVAITFAISAVALGEQIADSAWLAGYRLPATPGSSPNRNLLGLAPPGLSPPGRSLPFRYPNQPPASGIPRRPNRKRSPVFARCLYCSMWC